MIELHDLTGYKGQLYGKTVSPELQAEYSQLIGKTGEINKGGNNLADVPEARAKVARYFAKVQAFLNEATHLGGGYEVDIVLFRARRSDPADR